MRVLRLAKKLEPKFTGPYKVARRESRQAAGGNYHLVNFRSQPLTRSYPLDQLKVVDPEYAEAVWTAAKTTKVFPVEKLIDHRFVNGQPQYLVQWKGHDDEFNSWEPESALASPSA